MKQKGPRQTVCTEPGDTPKKAYCGGKLKRITVLDSAAARLAGEDQDVLRCQICGTLYSEPNPFSTLKR